HARRACSQPVRSTTATSSRRSPGCISLTMPSFMARERCQTAEPRERAEAAMKLGIVKEMQPGERRVAASPQGVAKWVKAGWEVAVERGAGEDASYPDAQYTAAGAAIVER